MVETNNQITDSSDNVFADPGFEQVEVENLLVRSKLMAAIKTYIESEDITQGEAAERFGVAQPQISEIYQGKIEMFSVDKLINMLARVGQHVEVTIYEAESTASRKKPSDFFENFDLGDGRVRPGACTRAKVVDKLKKRREHE